MKAGSTYKILLVVFFWLAALVLRAQNRPANIWASVQFNRSSVAVGEPLLVTITVYTSTWFTAPPEFGEIQVPEAMMLDYQQRTGSLRKTIGNKSYPAIEKKFVVYPFRTGENSLPSLTIVCETPDEGDYKGKRRVIRSPERMFTVLPPAEGVAMENWLTAYQVNLTERWDKPMDQLKQGDVRTRQISITASGAVAALIPPLELNSGSFGNVYSRPASLSNVQNQFSFTGTRIEQWNYLMVEEGQHVIPGVELSWYDPASGWLKIDSIEEREVYISENPNLDFLLSMQDSLQTMLEEDVYPEEKEAFAVLGLNWWQLTLLVLSVVALIIILFRTIRRIFATVRERKNISRETEQWYFSQLVKSASDTPETFMRALVNWFDRYREGRYGPDLGSFVKASGDTGLRHHLTELERILYAGEDAQSWNGIVLADHIRRVRKRANGKTISPSRDKNTALNPVDTETLAI